MVKIYDDRPTVLMADDASLSGRFGVWRERRKVKRFHVTGFTSPSDTMEWVVESPVNGLYAVTALLSADNAELRLATSSDAIVRPADSGPTGWNRLELGQLHLKAGLNRIELSSPKAENELELYSLELCEPALKLDLERQAAGARSDTSWLRKARYGLQFHWTSQSFPRHGARKGYADAVGDFDVDAFAGMVREAGAGYAILTTSHAEQYFPAPIASIDAIMGGRTTGRDLVGELISALGEYGIRLMLYYHVGHGHWREPDGWWVRTGYDPADPSRFLANWLAIMTEIGERYGAGLAGWFYDDGCVYYPLNPDFRELTGAAKAGYPGRLVCYNPWVWPRFTDFQDYFCGEGYGFLKTDQYLPDDGSGVFIDGPHKGLQAHTNFVLEERWCHDVPDTVIQEPAVAKSQFVSDMVSAIGRGIVASPNLEIYQDGGCGERSLDYIRAVRDALDT